MSNTIKNLAAKQSITQANAKRHRNRWTEEQDAQLISMLGEKPYVQIGVELGRTYHSVRQRVLTLKFRGVIARESITVPWQPSEAREVGPYTIHALEQRVQNYNEKYTRACQERDGFRERMLTAQEQERRARKQSAEMQADFQDYKIEGERLAIQHDQLMAENKELTKQRDGFEGYSRHHLAQVKIWQESSDEKHKQLACLEKEFQDCKIAGERLEMQLEQLTTRNQELLASGRVMEDSLKNQAARLRLAESENDRLRRVAIEIKRKTSIVITVLIVLVTVVVLEGLML